MIAAAGFSLNPLCDSADFQHHVRMLTTTTHDGEIQHHHLAAANALFRIQAQYPAHPIMQRLLQQ
jgi:hypothetical protein